MICLLSGNAKRKLHDRVDFSSDLLCLANPNKPLHDLFSPIFGICMNIFRHITSKKLRSAASPDFADGGGASSFQKKAEKDEREKSALEDAEWVVKAQSGDTRAFDQLVTKHRGKVYAMIVNMVKNDAEAWDLSQEAFVKAWKALPKFEARARFTTWLFRISHNVVYDWMRKRHIESEGELNDELFDAGRIDSSAATAPQQSKRPDEAMVQSELRKEIQDALDKLSPEHLEVILLREVQGMDYKEIAKITENSMGTVMSRIFYARKKLQTYLKPES